MNMKNQILLAKTTVKELNLLIDMYISLKKEAEKRKKPIFWFRYAKRGIYSYRFLKNKSEQWDLLEQIAVSLGKKYKNFTTGEIVDIISELVNNTVKDSVLEQGRRLIKNLLLSEKNMLICSLLV